MLDDQVPGKHAEIRLSNDLELHPWDFAQHRSELPVQLHEDDNTVRVA